jgi:hypothetical protein
MNSRLECLGIESHGLLTLQIHYETSEDQELAGPPLPRYCVFCGLPMSEDPSSLAVKGESVALHKETYEK